MARVAKGIRSERREERSDDMNSSSFAIRFARRSRLSLSLSRRQLRSNTTSTSAFATHFGSSQQRRQILVQPAKRQDVMDRAGEGKHRQWREEIERVGGQPQQRQQDKQRQPTPPPSSPREICPKESRRGRVDLGEGQRRRQRRGLLRQSPYQGNDLDRPDQGEIGESRGLRGR